MHSSVSRCSIQAISRFFITLTPALLVSRMRKSGLVNSSHKMVEHQHETGDIISVSSEALYQHKIKATLFACCKCMWLHAGLVQ